MVLTFLEMSIRLKHSNGIFFRGCGGLWEAQRDIQWELLPSQGIIIFYIANTVINRNFHLILLSRPSWEKSKSHNLILKSWPSLLSSFFLHLLNTYYVFCEKHYSLYQISSSEQAYIVCYSHLIDKETMSQRVKELALGHTCPSCKNRLIHAVSNVIILRWGEAHNLLYPVLI